MGSPFARARRSFSVSGMTQNHRLTSGDTAPDFTLLDDQGESVSLGDHRGHKVLVYFYPRASTPGCTTQACGLRDVLGDIGDTVVLGISPDLPKKLAGFSAKYELGFPLLSDPDHVTAEAYGVWGEKKLYGKVSMGIIRSSFLIDADGVIEQAWYKVSPADTPKNLLAALA